MESWITTENLPLLIIFLLSQVIQYLVIRRGQNGAKNPHGFLTDKQHMWLEQIWKAIVLGKKET